MSWLCFPHGHCVSVRVPRLQCVFFLPCKLGWHCTPAPCLYENTSQELFVICNFLLFLDRLHDILFNLPVFVLEYVLKLEAKLRILCPSLSPPLVPQLQRASGSVPAQIRLFSLPVDGCCCLFSVRVPIAQCPLCRSCCVGQFWFLVATQQEKQQQQQQQPLRAQSGSSTETAHSCWQDNSNYWLTGSTDQTLSGQQPILGKHFLLRTILITWILKTIRLARRFLRFWPPV